MIQTWVEAMNYQKVLRWNIFNLQADCVYNLPTFGVLWGSRLKHHSSVKPRGMESSKMEHVQSTSRKGLSVKSIVKEERMNLTSDPHRLELRETWKTMWLYFLPFSFVIQFVIKLLVQKGGCLHISVYGHLNSGDVSLMYGFLWNHDFRWREFTAAPQTQKCACSLESGLNAICLRGTQYLRHRHFS